MDTEHDPDSVTPPSEQEKAERLDPLDPWARMHQAAQELTESVQALPVPQPPIVIPPFRLPRLQLTYEDDGTPPAPPDPRHTVVSVRTVPMSCGTIAAWHDYTDPDGLTWQTYGDGTQDFTTERMLEIQNSVGDVVASYLAGTWLDICYPSYRRPSELKDLS